VGSSNIATGRRLYRGERTKDAIVITVHRAPGDFHRLDDGQVRALLPEGDQEAEFDWGRASPAAERLAAALLRDALEADADPELSREFAGEILIPLPYLDPWVLWSEDLQAWAQEKLASRSS